MELASPLPLDASGQPKTAVDEVQYKLQNGVDFYNGAEKVRKGDVCIVTSHRIAVIDAERRGPLQWHLSQVTSISSEEAGFFVGSAKIVIAVKEMSGPARAGVFKLSFKSGGRDAVLESLNKARERRSWVPAVPPADAAKAKAEPQAVMALPGIRGIIIKEKEALRHDAELARDAFSDLGELEKHAKSLVALAETYAAEIQRKKAAAAAAAASAAEGGAAAGGGSPSPLDADASSDLGTLVTTLGIVNPVTRAMAGNLFNEEVARQLASFIRPILERSGGMLSLTDVYCLYNRARVTDLISPDDLLAAARTLESLRPAPGVRLRTFPSGLRVLQHDAFSDAQMADRLRALLQQDETAAAAAAAAGGVAVAGAGAGAGAAAARVPCGRHNAFIAAPQLAARLKMPLQVATQHLLLAETAGVLCRDDSINGLRFYLNKFV